MTPPEVRSKTWKSPKMLPVYVELHPACWALPAVGCLRPIDGDDDDNCDDDDDDDGDGRCDDDEEEDEDDDEQAYFEHGDGVGLSGAEAK